VDELTKQYFIDVFGSLPRCGPGSVETTRRAYSCLKDVPANPKILDIGVGIGISTIELAKISKGTIFAIDIIPEYLKRLKEKMDDEDVQNITTLLMSMDDITFPEDTFDIIWSEGSVFIIGIERGLKNWKDFLKSGGYLAFSDMIWFNRNAPRALKEYIDTEYEGLPKMLDNGQILNLIKKHGYKLVAYFKLDEKRDWWDNFYIPLEKSIPYFRNKYKDNKKYLDMLELNVKEIENFRKYSDFYGYMFYILQKK